MCLEILNCMHKISTCCCTHIRSIKLHAKFIRIQLHVEILLVACDQISSMPVLHDVICDDFFVAARTILFAKEDPVFSCCKMI